VTVPVGHNQKWCTKCKEAHDVSAFGRDRTRYDGLQAACKESHKNRNRNPEYFRAYYKKTRDKQQAKSKARYNANWQEACAWQKEYYHTHKDAIRARIRSQPTLQRSYRHARAGRMRGAGHLTSDVVHRVLAKNFCAYCREPFNETRKKTIDHVVPLSKGGTNAEHNLVAACGSCNSKKNARTGEEFLRLYFPHFLSDAR
jgi:5-methylcytosine-specific restriction endonuclease McrA